MENPYRPPESDTTAPSESSSIPFHWVVLALFELVIGVIVVLIASLGVVGLVFARETSASLRDWMILLSVLSFGVGFVFSAKRLRQGKLPPQLIWVAAAATLALFVMYG